MVIVYPQHFGQPCCNRHAEFTLSEASHTTHQTMPRASLGSPRAIFS